MQIYLEERNIQTRVVFTGNVLRQPMMKGVLRRERKLGYPNSDNVMKRSILLPLHHGMTEGMFEYFHQTFQDFLKKYN